jgi:cell division protein FtsI/penicillin-binding protein 2
MVNVVAADGILAPLKIIKGIITNDSKFATLEDEDDRMYTRAIKVETAKLMREIMAKVTDEGAPEQSRHRRH